MLRRMGRAKTILQSEFPYNIGARCINREWFNLPMERVWEIFCEEMKRTIKEKDLKVHSFVLMSNHFHLIASTPRANISECMHQFMAMTSRRLTKEGNRINETYAGRHYKCILNCQNYYLNAYKYNYRNPVAAGACKHVEDYPYSTLRGLINPVERKFPICEDTTFNADPRGILRWLNVTPDPNKLEAVRFGLKRQYFISKKDTNNGKPIIAENELL
jgi:putative transposase